MMQYSEEATFGLYLKQIRKSKGISIREVSRRTGVSHPYLSQLETGFQKYPSRKAVEKIAIGLGINRNELMAAAGYAEVPETVENKFGEYLRELRGKKSLRTVSEESGISHSYLSTLEKGYDPRTQKGRKPNPEILKKLAKSLEVDYEELMIAAGYIEEEPGDNKKVLEGTAFVTEVECGGYYGTYGDVLCESGNLTDEIEEYAGKKVRITIEEID